MWCNPSNISAPANFPQENSTNSYLSYGGGKLPPGFILQKNFQQTPNKNLLVPQPQIQYYTWSNPTQLMNYPVAQASHMGPVYEQIPNTPYSQQPLSNAGKSVLVTKFNNVRQDNELLAEEMEEQKQRNSLLMQRITDVQKELKTVQQTAVNLYNECQSIDETCERFSKQLDEEKRKLSETVTKKRCEITKVKVDAELVATLREEKERSVSEIARLRDDVIDGEIDVDNLTIKFQYELGKMVIFPFWKLEEEIDKVLPHCGLKSYVEECSKEQIGNNIVGRFCQERFASGSNESSERKKSEDSLEENSAENFAEQSWRSSREGSQNDHMSVTSRITVIKVNNPAEHNCSVDRSSSLNEFASNQPSAPSVNDGCVETGDRFVEDLSFAHSKAPKKPGKKIRKTSCLARWFRRLCCITKRNKDQ